MSIVDQLIFELKVQGGQAAKQNVQQVREEVNRLELGLNALGTIGGLTVLFANLQQITETLGSASGLSMAVELKAISTQLEIVTGSATRAASAMRMFREMSLKSPYDVQTISGFGSRLIGAGMEGNALQTTLKGALDLISLSNARTPGERSILLNELFRVKSEPSSITSQEWRVFASRIPAMDQIARLGVGGNIQAGHGFEALKSLGSGAKMFDALIKGTEKLAPNASEEMANRNPILAFAKMMTNLMFVMEPTGEILLKVLTPMMFLLEKFIEFLGWINRITGGTAGLVVVLISGTTAAILLTGALSRATVSMLQLAAASGVFGAAGSAAAASGSSRALGGVAIGAMASWIGLIVSRILPGILVALPFFAAGSYFANKENGTANDQKIADAANNGGVFAVIMGIVGTLGAIAAGVTGLPALIIGGVIALAAGATAFAVNYFRGDTAQSEQAKQQAETNRLLKDIKYELIGGGKGTQGVVSEILIERSIARMMATGAG